MFNIKRLFQIGVIFVILMSLFTVDSMIAVKQAQPEGAITLIRPVFVDSVSASSPKETVIADILDEEAGISAYMESTFSINLNSVRGIFTTVEYETSDYILGSIDMPDYPGVYNPHVYVHKDGWVVAYYFRGDPVSKMLDVKARTIDSTLLYEAISIIASGGGIPVSDVYYYDFRYPNATHMMFVAEDEDDGDGNYFSISIPSSYGYFERSFSVAEFYVSTPYVKIDGVNVSAIYGDYDTRYGSISPSVLTTDVIHNVDIEDYGVIVLVYRVP